MDESRRGAGAELIAKAQDGRAPRQEADFRRVLDDPKITVLIVAVPHHWHALIALRALAAGKHLYLEKPASHVFAEGPALVAAARKSGKILQHGTQMRSSPVTLAAGEVLKSGVLGAIKLAKAWGVEPRGRRARLRLGFAGQGLERANGEAFVGGAACQFFAARLGNREQRARGARRETPLAHERFDRIGKAQQA